MPSKRPPSPFALPQLTTHRARRQLLREGARASEDRDHSFRRVILSVPPGRVSTYGHVATAAGYPRLQRAVARLLRTDPPDSLPWHRIVGAGGHLRLRGESATEQRARLLAERVPFLGARVDLARAEHPLTPWHLP